MFEYVTGLAVEGTAEGLEERFAGVMPTFAASSPEDILRRASIMSMFTIIAMTVRLDGESVFFADSDRKAVDEGEGEEYQRSQKHSISDVFVCVVD